MTRADIVRELQWFATPQQHGVRIDVVFSPEHMGDVVHSFEIRADDDAEHELVLMQLRMVARVEEIMRLNQRCEVA